MKLSPTPQEYFDNAVRLSGKDFHIEESLSGYYRLLCDDDIIHDDSACEDVYELNSALYMFAEHIFENYTEAKWDNNKFRYQY